MDPVALQILTNFGSGTELVFWLIAAFAGGCFGAAIGALPAFCFTGFAVIAGEALTLASVSGAPTAEGAEAISLTSAMTGTIGFGPVFGPHIAFAGGAAAAAYAARADLDSHVFLPTRAGFTNKAMVNVHGGDMTVVPGRFDDARAEYEERRASRDWYPVDAGETPFRREGLKTLLYELVAENDWTAPDAIVVPTGHGLTLAGVHRGATELRDLGLIEELPRLYAAQAAGCAPIVEAWDEGAERHEPWETPDTIVGELEIPDPGAGALALDALRESDGGAVAVPDPDALETAVAIAQNEGLGVGAAGGTAAAGAWELAQQGAFDADDTVVLVNTSAATKEADVLRSHLMGQGI